VADTVVASVERRYERAALRAAIVVMLGWHLCAVLPSAIGGWPYYQPAWAGLAIWLVDAVVGVILAVVVWRGGGRSIGTAVWVAMVVLVGVVVVAWASPTGTPMDPYSWAYSTSAWFVMVAVWRLRVRALMWFLVANTLVGLAVLIASGNVDRVSVARFVIVSYGVSVLQVTVLVGSRIITSVARRIAEAQEAQARLANRQLAAGAVHDARRVRFDEVRQAAAELLADLADDRLDLTDAATQQRMRIAVSRLRRLIVETDEVPEPLQHELRACADAAERRGVEVDLPAPVGRLPSLSVTARRALTEPVIHVLAGARTRARITVVSRSADVTVAVVADAPLDTVVAGGGEAELILDSEGDLLWAQTRWNARSPSLS
jgi:hypothetical protein